MKMSNDMVIYIALILKIKIVFDLYFIKFFPSLLVLLFYGENQITLCKIPQNKKSFFLELNKLWFYSIMASVQK